MSKVKIYHNPLCSKSRQTLNLLKERDIDLETVLYLETPPDETELRSLLKMLGIGAKDLIRTSEQAYKDLNLADNSLSDDQLIHAMIESPKLIQRPIVVSNGKAAIGRPPEQVLAIL